MDRKSALVVALLTFTLMGLELTWTRVFSAEFFYTFGFLVLSLAILGLGLGSLFVHLVPRCGNERFLGPSLCLAGLMTMAGPPLVFLLGLDFTQLFHSAVMVARLAAALVILGAAFFFGGMALALVFRRDPGALPRLYMADLGGAAAGVLGIVLLMNAAGTPVAAFLCALPVLAGAFIMMRRWWRLVPVALAAAILPLGLQADRLLELKRDEPAPVIYRHWDAMAKIKIYGFSDDYHGINIDNAANSPVHRFDGNWDRPDSERFEFGIDPSWLIERQPNCTFLSLGAGGGMDVLLALQAGAAEVHAVEVIPHVNRLMTRGELGAFGGDLYRDPRVHVATEDARAYVRRFHGKFDMIYSLSSNTFAAMASGAFALAENYLFTTEAFKDYWGSLTDRGYMMMEHQYYMSRLVSELHDALKEMGVPEPTSHFAVYNLPTMRRKMVLISKQPLTDEIRTHAFGELTLEKAEEIHLLFPPDSAHAGNVTERIVREGWPAVAKDVPIDISPCRDNRPFTAQMGLWKNFSFGKLEKVSPFEVAGFPLAKLLILTITTVVLVLIVPLNLIPFVRRGERLRPIPWLYFFTIGMAFMSVEVILIQKYALLIGPSVYSLITILLALLLGSSVGSRFAPKVDHRVAFGGIIVWILVDVLGFRHVPVLLGGLPLIGRMLGTAILVCPVGFFMGMPFPKGGLRVGSLIPWGLGVNGAASVLGSTLIVLVAITHGFAIALLIAAALYLVALLLYSYERGWRPTSAPDESGVPSMP